MVPVYPDKLSAHVAATNLANQIRNDLIDTAYHAWEHMLGKKVLKADGWRTKAADIPLTIDHEKYGLGQHDYRVWADFSPYSIRYSLWVDVHYNYMVPAWGEREAEERQSHITSEAVLIVGSVEKGILVKIEKQPLLRTDYSVDVVLAARKELRELQEKEREIKSRIGHFGEY